MNANYQYFMMSGYDYVSGKGGGKGGDIIGGGGGGGGQDIIVEEAEDDRAPMDFPTRPMPEMPRPIYSKPIVNDVIDDVSPIESKPISTIGDAALITKDPTTINIYNPEGGTSTTSTESEVTVDANTGKVTTPASKGGARGGGGGIGGGKGKGKGKPSAAPKSAKKAIIPLAAIGIGVAILIFKPFKFLK